VILGNSRQSERATGHRFQLPVDNWKIIWRQRGTDRVVPAARGGNWATDAAGEGTQWDFPSARAEGSHALAVAPIRQLMWARAPSSLSKVTGTMETWVAAETGACSLPLTNISRGISGPSRKAADVSRMAPTAQGRKGRWVAVWGDCLPIARHVHRSAHEFRSRSSHREYG